MRRMLGFGMLVAAVFAGCGSDVRDETDSFWDLEGTDDPVAAPINFKSRDDGSYGLPRDGQPSIQAVLDIMLAAAPNASVSEAAQAASNYTNQDCSSSNATVTDQLPITVEGVVTLHPRQFFKKLICAQDQRFYGSFVIEDDTAGITILRDSRVAPFTFGDRVRVTIDAMTAGFNNAERVVFVADIEVLSTGAGGEVLYQTASESFADTPADDLLGKVFRAEGNLFQRPTNNNFGALIISSRSWAELPAQPASDATISSACVEFCRSQCRSKCPVEGGEVVNPQGATVDLCNEQLCPALCEGEGTQWSDSKTDELPICWEVNIDSELTRRGALDFPIDTRMRVTGPVVDSFGRKILAIRLGQIEVLN